MRTWMRALIKQCGLLGFARQTVTFCHRISCRINYPRILRRIRRKMRIPGNKIRVVFLVDTAAKWKCQSVYEEMRRSALFDPVIGIVVPKAIAIRDQSEVVRLIDNLISFFKCANCDSVVLYNLETQMPIEISELSPDIVFLQQPQGYFKGQRVCDIAHFALCCYVPYGVEYGDEEYPKINALHWQPEFHQLLYLYFDWSPVHAEYCRKYIPRQTVAEIQSLGHPIYDELIKHAGERNKGFIIYAPHFSFPSETPTHRSFVSGTFLENGQFFLDYARRHPEQKWVFKPHPGLFRELIVAANWRKEDVESYYRAWADIGIVADSGNYAQLFYQSKVLITDSASFLIEYPVTNNPIVWLRRRENPAMHCEAVDPLFRTYYSVYDMKELEQILRTLVEQGEDPKRAARVAEVEKLCLSKGASNKIVSFIVNKVTVP